ncbi:MAG: hypothetical protein NZM39_12470, partial [Bernardetiaceae bacterium]|nr:hypothetical protein [Bernardetiaceae bacterium]
IEMANIHTNILSGLMDAYASVINNNMNQVMKTLTKITIVLMIPTLIASIYGMNIQLPFQNQANAFSIILSIAIMLTVLVVWMFNRIKIFK